MDRTQELMHYAFLNEKAKKALVNIPLLFTGIRATQLLLGTKISPELQKKIHATLDKFDAFKPTLEELFNVLEITDLEINREIERLSKKG